VPTTHQQRQLLADVRPAMKSLQRTPILTTNALHVNHVVHATTAATAQNVHLAVNNHQANLRSPLFMSVPMVNHWPNGKLN
jgi:hypothetical protein